MNTRPIPIIITLLAALVSCVASILQHVSFEIFTARLLLSVIVFAVIGSIAKYILDRTVNIMGDEDKDGDDEDNPESVGELSDSRED